MRTCTKCKIAKPAEEFWKNSRAKDGLQPKCKPCHSANISKSGAKNNKLFKSYGITLAQFEELQVLWEGKCGICDGQEPSSDKRSLAVDHDHKEGHVRGLLCSKCNRGIGMFNENIELLERAINYLKAYKEALEEHNALNPIQKQKSHMEECGDRNESR